MESQPLKITRKHSLPHWIRQHQKLSYIIAGALLVAAAGSITFFILSKQSSPTKPAPSIVVKEPMPAPKYYSELTGALVKNETDITRPVTAIMIENSPDARPQSGLKQAEVVYEAIAEGGITRFMALYQQEKPNLIGPVRSLRTAFVDWLAPYQASVAHVGGNIVALNEIRNGSYRDIDQFFNAGTYWRSSDRFAPHNVYTSFDNLDALNKAKGYERSAFSGFIRTNPKPALTPTAAQINVNVSSPTYNSSYVYDKKNNSYARSQGGAPHLDREKGQITATVVIALNVDMRAVEEDGYREQITTIGSGKATIFQNGTALEATWTKKDRASQLTFEDENGEVIPLVRGTTWITAIPNNGGSVSWK